ncbi:STAS domain-containing protein [Bremerella sp. JC770]|uniref:STAS domain-containing protein n=1 Tax=Bremerella sp. JC770 TaxID=3232137 RepID=UPI0034574AD8
MNLQIISTKDSHVHIAVSGKVSQDGIPRDQEPIATLLGPEAYTLTVLLDLKDAEVIDSSGIGWLLVCQKRFAENGGRMVCYSAPPAVANVFKLMRMDLVFDNAANASEAEKLAGVNAET